MSVCVCELAFEVFTTAGTKITDFFCEVILYSLLDRYQKFSDEFAVKILGIEIRSNCRTRLIRRRSGSKVCYLNEILFF